MFSAEHDEYGAGMFYAFGMEDKQVRFKPNAFQLEASKISSTNLATRRHKNFSAFFSLQKD